MNKCISAYRLGALEVLSQNGAILSYNGFKPTYKELPNYSHLIQQSLGNVVSHGNQNLSFVVHEIVRVIQLGRKQVVPLARHLYAPTVAQACFNVWHFIKRNIKYDFDKPGVEAIRTPARVWADRRNQNDCEDYAVFASALLLNMGYRPVLKIVAFNGSPNFQHIYVQCNGITVDGVLNQFNEEPKNITKSMYTETLGAIPGEAGEANEYIHGVAGIKPVSPLTKKLLQIQNNLLAHIKTYGKTPSNQRELRKVRTLISMNGAEEQADLVELMPYIHDVGPKGEFVFESTAQQGEFNRLYNRIEADNARIEMNALSGFESDELGAIRDDIDAEIDAEQSLRQNQLYGLGSIEQGEFLAGKAKREKRKAKRAERKANRKEKRTKNKAARKEARAQRKAERKGKKGLKKVGVVLKQAGTAAKKVGQKAWQVVKKVALVTVAARNAFLGLVQLNFKGLATKMAIGYATLEQALQMGYSAQEHAEAVSAAEKGDKHWKNIGGNVSKLHGAVNRGKAKGKKGKAVFKNTAAVNNKKAPLQDHARKGPSPFKRRPGAVVKVGGKLRGVDSWDEVEDLQAIIGLGDGGATAGMILTATPILVVFVKLFASIKARSASGEPLDVDDVPIASTGDEQLDEALKNVNEITRAIAPKNSNTAVLDDVSAEDQGFDSETDKKITKDALDNADKATDSGGGEVKNGDTKDPDAKDPVTKTAGIGTGAIIGTVVAVGAVAYIATKDNDKPKKRKSGRR